VARTRAVEQNPADLKVYKAEYELLIQIQAALNAGNNARVKELVQSASVPTVPLLSAKKILVVANVAETDIETYRTNPHYQALVKFFGADIIIPICVKTESELAQLPPAEAAELMAMLGIQKRGLDLIIQKSYKHLGLITFFTCGPKEVHAWPIVQGLTIRKAAGEIHSDLERGFICSEIFNCADLFELGSETKVKVIGRIRTEGQDYIVTDGDIIHIKFNV